jgi:hypothetical protein
VLTRQASDSRGESAGYFRSRTLAHLSPQPVPKRTEALYSARRNTAVAAGLSTIGKPVVRAVARCHKPE